MLPATVVPSPAVVARLTQARVLIYAAAGDPHAYVQIRSVTELGNPRVLLTTARRGDWIQVLLPMRPNNSTGWVRSSDVTLDTVPDAIDVDLASRTLTWTRNGQVLARVSAAVGAPSSPTPVGRFFVTDVLRENPNGALGAWVIALDAHSDVFATFEGGDARIAIHGTNDPGSVGQPVSNGCVRVAAAPLALLAANLAPGTPVTVH